MNMNNMNMENQTQQVQQQNQQDKGRKQSLLLLLLLLLVSVTVGYAALSATLNIQGTTTVKNSSWDIGIPEVECPTGETCTFPPECEGEETCDVTPTDPTCNPETDPDCVGGVIWMKGNTVYFKNVLEKPGDVFTFNATFRNNGTIDAKVSNVVKSELNATAQQFLTYTVTYADGSTINEGDLLNAGQSVTCKVTVTYKSTVTVLPTEQQLALINEIAEGHTGATSLFTITYEQK